jgi:hypothetical protein
MRHWCERRQNHDKWCYTFWRWKQSILNPCRARSWNRISHISLNSAEIHWMPSGKSESTSSDLTFNSQKWAEREVTDMEWSETIGQRQLEITIRSIMLHKEIWKKWFKKLQGKDCKFLPLTVILNGANQDHDKKSVLNPWTWIKQVLIALRNLSTPKLRRNSTHFHLWILEFPRMVSWFSEAFLSHAILTTLARFSVECP